MAGGYGFFNADSSGRSFSDEEFEEEDVWSVVMDIKGSNSMGRKPKDATHTSSVSSTPTMKRFPTASRMIPKANNSSQEAKPMQKSSAPINIPDWSKIYGKNPTEGSDSYSYSYGCGGGGGRATVSNSKGFDGIIGDVNDDDYLIPPHEWIAKKLSMGQIPSFSVCEGVGRTLKGRDLSKVRNAVLTRTGFLE